MKVAAAHSLKLPYPSPCGTTHGHCWEIQVTLQGPALNPDGMLVDFAEIKRVIHDQLDHKNLSGIIPGNPTAENIALWVAKTLQELLLKSDETGSIIVSEVMIQESEGSIITWIP